LLYTYPAIEAALIECGAGSTSVRWLRRGADLGPRITGTKSFKLCGTMPNLDELRWLNTHSSCVARCQTLYPGAVPTLVYLDSYPEFCEIVSRKHQKLFAQRVACRLGFKIILQHMQVNHELASTIVSYLSGIDVFGIPKGGKGNALNPIGLPS
jgi:hypothetical protein